MFYGCNSLISITIPSSVKSIGADAFSGCIALTSITIPSSVTLMDYRAFSGCTNLVSAYFEGDAPSIVSTDIFANCSSAFKIYYKAGKTGWTTPTWTPPHNPVYNTATF